MSPVPATPPAVDRVLFDGDAIATRVAQLGRAITEDYSGSRLRLITVLRGGVIFLADLCRVVDLDLTLDFMAISSYAGGVEGSVRIVKDLDDPIQGADVLVVEDIIDTGLTLNYIMRNLRSREPASLEVCTLLDKDARRIADLPIRYRGFQTPDRFLVGYGLDIEGLYRNLPYIATVHDEAVGL